MCFFWTAQPIHRRSSQKPGMSIIKCPQQPDIGVWTSVGKEKLQMLWLTIFAGWLWKVLVLSCQGSKRKQNVFVLKTKQQQVWLFTKHNVFVFCFTYAQQLGVGVPLQNTSFETKWLVKWVLVLVVICSRTAHFVWPYYFSPCFSRLSQTAKTQCKVSRGFTAGHSQIPMCSASKILRFMTLYRCPLERLASRWEMTKNSDNLSHQCSEHFTHEKLLVIVLSFHHVNIIIIIIIQIQFSLQLHLTQTLPIRSLSVWKNILSREQWIQ